MADYHRVDEAIPRVAVLLASHNGAEWLIEQLASVAAQKNCKLHVFVNDDASTDDTVKILESQISIPDFNISKDFCGGAGANFLHLVSKTDFSEFEYVAFCDQDDIWNEDKLDRAIHQMRKKNADAYSANVTAFWPDHERRTIVKSQPQRKFDFLFESAGPGCTFVLPQHTALKLQRALEAIPIQQRKEIALHDWFVYSFVRGGGGKWLIDNYSALEYRQHDRNVLGASRSGTALAKRWKMVSDGWYLKQARLNCSLLGHSMPPAKFLSTGGLGHLLSSLFRVFELRRRKSEAILVGMILLREFFTGGQKDKK